MATKEEVRQLSLDYKRVVREKAELQEALVKIRDFTLKALKGRT